MLNKITIINFRAFKNVTLDLTKNKKEAKHYAFIYGENASGKSSIIYALGFLKKSIDSLKVKKVFDGFVETNKEHINEEDINMFKNALDYYSINETLAKDKRIGSKEDMKIIYEFFMGNKKFIYTIVCDNKSYVKEELVDGNSTNILFSIDKNKVDISSSLFKDKNYLSSIKEDIKKFFGLHTFLAIINREFSSNNMDYMKKKTSSLLYNLLNELNGFTLITRNYNSALYRTKHYDNLLNQLPYGEIETKNERVIDKTEKALKLYLTNLCTNIIDVYYKKDYKKANTISYTLFLKRKNNGETIDVPIASESSGTLKVIELFPYIYKAINGETVIVDELDDDIHDLLMEYIIDSSKDLIKGQFIMTTHNTRIMENIKPDSIYIIEVDTEGNRKVENIKELAKKRIQKNHNVNYEYLHGLYGGIPVVGYLDFLTIQDVLNGDNSGKK